MERLGALMQGRLPDRVPVFCNLLDQGARELGMDQETYYSRGAHVAEGQLRLREKYGHDNVWGYFYVGREAEYRAAGRSSGPKRAPRTSATCRSGAPRTSGGSPSPNGWPTSPPSRSSSSASGC